MKIYGSYSPTWAVFGGFNGAASVLQVLQAEVKKFKDRCGDRFAWHLGYSIFGSRLDHRVSCFMGCNLARGQSARISGLDL